MAAQSDTFLFRIITQLDDTEAFNEVAQELSIIGDQTEQARGSIQNLTSELRKMAPKSNIDQIQNQLQSLKGPTDISGLQQMRSQLESLERGLDDGSQASQRLKKVIEGIDTADFKVLSNNVEGLKKDLQGVEPSFQDIQEQLQRLESADSIPELRRRFEVLQKTIRDSEDAIEKMKAEGTFGAFQQRLARIENRFQEVQNDVALAGGAIEKRLGQNLKGVNTQVDQTRLKTNQMSQAMLQGMQDAQFGVIGVANNIQMMGEALSRQMSKGVSITRTLGATFMNLIAGPMAIGTVITLTTLLLQNLDKMPEPVKDFVKQLGFAQTEMEKILESTRKAVKEMTKIEKGGIVKTFADLDELEGGGAIRRFLGERLGQVNQQLLNVNEAGNQMVEMAKELNKQGVMIDPQAPNALQKFAKHTDKSVKELKNLRDAAKLSIQDVKDLRKEQEFLTKVMKATNAESVQELNARRRLRKVLNVSEERIRELAKAYVELKNQNEEANEETEKTIEQQERLAQLRADILSGVPGEIAQIQADLRANLRDAQSEDERDLLKLRAKGARKEAVREWYRSTMEKFVDAGKAMEFDVGEGFGSVFLPFGGPEGEDGLSEEARDRIQNAFEAAKAEIEFQQQQLQTREKGMSLLSMFGIQPTAGKASILQERESLELQLFQARIDRIRERAKLNQDGIIQNTEEFTQRELELWRRKAKKKYQIQKKWQQRRRQLRMKNMKRIQQQLTQNNPIARGTTSLISRLGVIWDQFHNNRLNWQQKNTRERAQIISSMGSSVISAADKIASGVFNTWMQKRREDLKQEGKTAEERRKILKEEGKKRFKIMKAIKIAQASANVAEGITQALALPFPLNWAQVAAVSAAGLFRIKQIAGLSIGDKLRGGGAGGGASGRQGGRFTQLSGRRNSRRAQNFARRAQEQSQSGNDQIKEAADKIDGAAKKIQRQEVKYDDRTAEDITQRGAKRSRSLNV